MCFQYFFFSPLSSQITGRWEERENKQIIKKILEAHQSFDNDTVGTVEKISTRWIQRQQGKSPMVTEVCHTSRPKGKWAPTHLDDSSNHRCDLPWCRWIHLVDIFPTMLTTLSLEFRCLWGLFFLFLSPSPLSSHYCKFLGLFLTLERLMSCRYHLWLSKLCYFSKYFMYYAIFLSAKNQKKSIENTH
jgi:hypothetical protein